MKRLSWIEWCAVTVLGTGFSPLAPATVASLATCALFWFVPALLRWPGALTIVPAFLGGVVLSKRALGVLETPAVSERWARFRRPNPRQTDPDVVVFDEFVGQWAALLTAPHTLWGFLAAFVLFRFFDIVKPFGVRKLETTPGGWGVMLDDLVAGVCSAGVILLARIAIVLWS